MGSSPRMRGKRSLHVTINQVVGLIPTYAGKTLGGLFHRELPRAHPHVCGENYEYLTQYNALRGSSPRMRGKQRTQDHSWANGGLIPTYAGKTLADMGFYPHTPSFRISLEPKASINPTRFLSLSPSGSAPIPASFAPPFSWP